MKVGEKHIEGSTGKIIGRRPRAKKQKTIYIYSTRYVLVLLQYYSVKFRYDR